MFTLARLRTLPSLRTFTTSALRASTVDSHFLSQITAAEKLLTHKDGPVPGGPTARAQAHANTPLTAQVVHDITLGERSITGSEEPVKGGPTAIAQGIISRLGGGKGEVQGKGKAQAGHTGTLDAETMRTITEKEKEITGHEGPVAGGPTAKAQQHAGEAITSEALSDITAGEKKITGGERIKGGPTSAAQSELGKSRS